MPQDITKAFEPRLIKEDDLYGEKAGYRFNLLRPKIEGEFKSMLSITEIRSKNFCYFTFIYTSVAKI